MKNIILSLIVFSFYLSGIGQTLSPFTNKAIAIDDTTNNYCFLVSGHFHGASNNTTGFPAKTLLANIKAINESECSFIVSLGDLFLDVKNDIPNYTDTLFNRLQLPLFNAVGNHDISGTIYQEHFGNTFFSFQVGSHKFLILDTELDDGSITSKQMEFFQKEIAACDSCTALFIFTHRLIWAEDHPEMKNLFLDNTRSSSPGNFRKDILPQLKTLGKTCPVYLFGGSMGNVPAPFFFHKERESNITYIATAIRDTPKDAMLKVHVNSGTVSFTALPLPMSPDYYSLDYYHPQEIKNKPFNWRLLPLYTKQAVSHRYFWYGVLFISMPIVILFFMYRRKRRKKFGR